MPTPPPRPGDGPADGPATAVARRLTAEVARRLAAVGCVAADAEAAEMVAAAPDAATLEGWVQQRADGVPLPWLTGTTSFAGLRLAVARGVYVPRPQSEELARRAVAQLPGRGWAADLCTGCGAVAAAVRSARPSAHVVGVEIDPAAARSALANGVPVVLGDLAAPLRSGAFDVVVAVAPYVPTDALGLLPPDVVRHEPGRALDGGADGLQLVRRVVAAAGRLLRPGGHLLVEVGGEQDRHLAPHLADAGLEAASPWFDDEGDLRGLQARRRA